VIQPIISEPFFFVNGDAISVAWNRLGGKLGAQYTCHGFHGRASCTDKRVGSSDSGCNMAVLRLLSNFDSFLMCVYIRSTISNMHLIHVKFVILINLQPNK
jgi:hypothetical protein